MKKIYQYQIVRELVEEDGFAESVAKKAVGRVFDKMKRASKNTMHKRIKFHGVGCFEVGGRGNV